MQVEAALDVVAERLTQARGVALTTDAREQLRVVLQSGRARAMEERDEESFDAAVEELAQQLGEVVRLVAMEGGKAEAYVIGESIEMAWRDICPLWPFC